jgi:hypothetical protein
VVEHRVWPYDRSGNRQASVQLALQMVVESLSHTSHMPRSTPNRGREVEAHT